MPLAFIAAIALIATGTLAWPIIFVPIGLTVVGKSMWGHGWNHDQDHHERHLHDRERRMARCATPTATAERELGR